jgi:anti-sigma B factor antagonist
MELQFKTLDDDVRLLKVIGRLDMLGTSEIENEFTAHCAGDKVRAIVDLSEVDFLASIGIRLLTVAAKSVARLGGMMVLLDPNPNVRNVLEMAGIPEIIPIYATLELALAKMRE